MLLLMERIDLIYEGIATKYFIGIPSTIQLVLERIDLIYEGIATTIYYTQNSQLFCVERIDLIYEGIATSDENITIFIVI